MGLLKADQLRNYAGTGNADLFKQWAAKAWVNFNGTGTVAVRDSRNVASITDSGVGIYIANYTSQFINANYAALKTDDNFNIGGTGSMLSASTQIISRNSAFATTDTTYLLSMANGDLA
jgi:hypothetical protein